MPTLDRIFIFPIKSLDGIEVRQAKILSGGALEHDREFCIVDQEGNWVNSKRTTKIHQIRSQYNLSARLVTLSVQNQTPVTFHLDFARDAIAAWLSNHLGIQVSLQQNLTTGFPDDPSSPGPTVVSTATLTAMANWFDGITVEDLRSRFRTNLELSDTPAFWEEQLYTADQSPRLFRIGEVELQGINPCQRCVVPTRNAITGEVYRHFQKIFIEKRKVELPAWTPTSRFNHYYRLAVNTRIDSTQTPRSLQVGDPVTLSESP
jgi:uncharacterized protein